MNYTYLDVAKMIDHSLLNPTLTVDDLEAGCRLAVAYDAASVCIMPYYLKRCAELLAGSTVKASTTIGFPHGGHTTETKLFETQQALADGGQELDMPWIWTNKMRSFGRKLRYPSSLVSHSNAVEMMFSTQTSRVCLQIFQCSTRKSELHLTVQGTVATP